MFGFSLRGLAEAAINTFTGATANDEEIAKLVKEAESQNSSFTCIVCMVCDEQKSNRDYQGVGKPSVSFRQYKQQYPPSYGGSGGE